MKMDIGTEVINLQTKKHQPSLGEKARREEGINSQRVQKESTLKSP